MAGLADMAGLTTPFGQWASQYTPGQNTLELPQVYSPAMQAEMLQQYLLTGQHPQHAQNSHANQRQYGSMPSSGNAASSASLPPYPPSLMAAMKQLLQAEPNMAPATQQLMQQFLQQHQGGQ